MIQGLSYEFHFPVELRRTFPLHHPEIRLVSLLIVATKLCFPFSGRSIPFSIDGMQLLPSMDWNRLQELITQPEDPSKSYDFQNVAGSDIAMMSEEKLATYFEYVSSFIEKKSEL